MYAIYIDVASFYQSVNERISPENFQGPSTSEF